MLEGKVPVNIASLPSGNSSIEPNIIFREGNSSQLHQELLNKENELKSEQEEKLLLKEKLENLQKHL